MAVRLTEGFLKNDLKHLDHADLIAYLISVHLEHEDEPLDYDRLVGFCKRYQIDPTPNKNTLSKLHSMGLIGLRVVVRDLDLRR